MSLKFEKKERLLRRMAAIPAAARKEIKAALEKSASEMAGTARTFAPIDSGDLKRSIGYTFGQFKNQNANVRGVGSGGGAGDPDLTVTIHAGDAQAFYAAFLEFGTVKSAAHPYFFPAYRLTRKRVGDRIKRAVRSAARKAAQS